MSHGSASGSLKDGIIDFIAGSLGGIGLVYVGQPLDTVKVKMQTFPNVYKGMINCFLETFKKEGIAKGLYAGTVPAVAANVAENSVLFAGYGACQKVMMEITGTECAEDLSVLSNASAGFCAAFFSSLTLCPTELVKCKLQAMREMGMISSGRHAAKIGPFQLTQQILHNEGIPGLFRGLTSTFVREMPGYFFFFAGYEATRELLTPRGKTKSDLGPFSTMVAGAVGGLVFWVVIFPADVIKSRIQVASMKDTMTSMFLRIFRQEGILALYNGLGPTVIRTIPATATLFLVYENTKKLLHHIFG